MLWATLQQSLKVLKWNCTTAVVCLVPIYCCEPTETLRLYCIYFSEGREGDAVLVKGARGLPPTDQYKISATYASGYRLTAVCVVMGPRAADKGRRTAEAILERYFFIKLNLVFIKKAFDFFKIKVSDICCYFSLITIEAFWVKSFQFITLKFNKSDSVNRCLVWAYLA